MADEATRAAKRAAKAAKVAAELDRERQVIEARIAGCTYAAIAKLPGFGSISTVRRVFLKAKSRLVVPDADERRQVQNERIESAVGALWHGVQQGHPRSVEVLIALLKREAELNGLDQPSKHEVTGELVVREYVGIDVKRMEFLGEHSAD